MKDWRQALIFSSTTIIDAMRAIDRAALQLALVVDDDHHLQGVVTDGDIRRGLLAGHPLSASVDQVMNASPTTVTLGESREIMLAMLKQKSMRQVPVLDEQGVIVDLLTLDDLINAGRRSNPVLLLAGGLGTRLRPLTQNVPKPMLNVGQKPILESIMESYARLGFYKFYFSVNYKADMIEAYFGDGARWDVKIEYLREEEPLGTAGALSLLPESDDDVMVMNGDILTNLNFVDLLDHHRQTESKATMCVREFDFQIPYGVVESEDGELTGLKEKPLSTFDINAGIYCISAEAVKRVPKHERFDMPRLFEELRGEGKKTMVYPIRDYWLDIGRIDDFEKAQQDARNILG